MTRRNLLRWGMRLGAAAGGLVFYTCQIEPRWPAYTNRVLPIPGLPKSLHGRKAVQLSDLHIGTRVADAYLRRQFEYVQSLNPDFVFYTGDFLDEADDLHLEKLADIVEALPQGKIGTAGVLGNHDFHDDRPGYPNTRRIAETLTDHGVQVLRDEVTDMGGLAIGGLEDFWSPNFQSRSARNVIRALPQSSLVLSHNPDTADLDIWNGFESWILCGHTHGGQCVIPLWGPPILPVENRSYVAGVYRFEFGRRMYINRGIGHTTRARFWARPEVTSFSLQSA